MALKVKLVDRDKGWKRFFKLADALHRQGKKVKVGILADSEKGAETEEGGDLTVAEIAAIMEYGTREPHTPARSFVRSTFDEKREELAKLAGTLIVKVLAGDLSAEQALGVLGGTLAGDIKKKVTVEGVLPANAPSTIAAK